MELPPALAWPDPRFSLAVTWAWPALNTVMLLLSVAPELAL